MVHFPQIVSHVDTCVVCADMAPAPCNWCRLVAVGEDSADPEIVVTRLPARGNAVAVAWREHPDGPLEMPMITEIRLRDAAKAWLKEHTDFAPDMELVFSEETEHPPYISPWAYLAHMQHTPEARASDYTPLVPSEGYVRHPHIVLNVAEMISPYELAQDLADAVAQEAQKFVGYWFGRDVSSGQMKPILGIGFGGDGTPARDISVQMHGQWVAPMAIPDDCIFCTGMTDDKVRERVAGFQWAMDQEVFNRYGGISRANYPSPHFEYTPEARAEYREKVVAWEAEHPGAFKSLDFPSLPLNLQRTLCIRWNHIWKDWLESRPDVSYKDGHWFRLTVTDDPLGRDLAAYYANGSSIAFIGGGF